MVEYARVCVGYTYISSFCYILFVGVLNGARFVKFHTFVSIKIPITPLNIRGCGQ